MATHYVEFDTNSQALFQDLRTQILASTDWARLTSDAVLLNTSGSTSAGGTSLPFANTAGSGLVIGSVISIGDGAVREYRTITAITGTSITVAAMTYAHPSASPIRWGNELYKATTTRGAEMVIDLNEVHLSAVGIGLSAALYQSHDGTTGVGKSLRYLYWRPSAPGAATPLHVILSLGKEHFFLSIEGPRPNESGAVSTTYGSLRNYIFMSDLVPYDAGDTNPVVIAGGQPTANADASSVALSYLGHASESLDGAALWVPTKLLTLDLPRGGGAEVPNVQRQRSIDGKFIFGPYVAFQDDTGMRGRLSSFFFAGISQPDSAFDVPPPPIGTKQEYQGEWYKLLAVNKTDASRNAWNQFGLTSNGGTGTYLRSAVVAVPCLP